MIERIGALLVGGGSVWPHRALWMPRDVHPPKVTYLVTYIPSQLLASFLSYLDRFQLLISFLSYLDRYPFLLT